MQISTLKSIENLCKVWQRNVSFSSSLSFSIYSLVKMYATHDTSSIQASHTDYGLPPAPSRHIAKKKIAPDGCSYAQVSIPMCICLIFTYLTLQPNPLDEFLVPAADVNNLKTMTSEKTVFNFYMSKGSNTTFNISSKPWPVMYIIIHDKPCLISPPHNTSPYIISARD